MLVKFITSGFKLFNESVELDMDVNKGKNTIDIKDNHLLKSAIIYGANNSGKSSFIDSLRTMRTLFRKGNVEEFPFFPYRNFFSDSKPISFEVEFLSFDYNYIYGLRVIDKDTLEEYLYINGKLVFSRSEDEFIGLDEKFFTDKIYQSTYDFLSNSEVFISKALSFTDKAPNKHISNIKNFFDKLIFFDNNEIGEFINLMVECLEDEKKRATYNQFVEKADISLKGKEITEEIGIPDFDEEDLLKEIKKEKDMKKEDIEILLKAIKVKSVYNFLNKDVRVPSSIFDSIGTSKFSNLLLLLMKTIEKGEILMIDEIDNSLHYRITRELIKMMNSSLNKRAQFIMSAHDIKLLTPLLFRKEQINFIKRSKEDIEMFSLGEFDEVRNDSSFENLYIKNKVGALPHPDLEEVISQWQESDLENVLED